MRTAYSSFSECNNFSQPSLSLNWRLFTISLPAAARAVACSLTLLAIFSVAAFAQGSLVSGSTAPDAGSGAPFQIRYASHLDIGDSVINITNDGSSASGTTGSAFLGNGNGDLCIGVYTFDMNEELQSCCTCLVTPNGLVNLSVQALNDTNLTGGLETSLVIKLLAWSTTAGASTTAPPGTPAPSGSSSCNAASPGTLSTPGGSANLASGMHAWGTTVHALPVGQPDSYTVTETEFSAANLSVAEFNHITQFCEFNQINGSGKFGQCKGCTSGGMGAASAQ